MNESNANRYESGVVLVTVLLYLLAVMFIVSGAFNISILQFKMNENFQNTDRAFQQAESALLQGQTEIEQSRLFGRGMLEDGTSYEFERLAPTYCGFWLYRIRASGVYQKAVKHLESMVLLPVESDECPAVAGKKRRVWWKE